MIKGMDKLLLDMVLAERIQIRGYISDMFFNKCLGNLLLVLTWLIQIDLHVG